MKGFKRIKFLFSIILLICLTKNAWAQIPVNDDPCSAIALPVSNFCNYVQYTNLNATASSGVPAPGCANYSGGDVWFSAVVPAGGQITFDSNTGTMTDGGMAVYSGLCSSLTLISCNNNGSANGAMPSITITGQTPGNTIFIRFWENGNNNNGTFSICAKAPIPCVASNSNSSCNLADPFCAGTSNNVCNTTGVPSLGSNGIYGCLGSTPNPSFYFLNISNSGPISMQISQQTNTGTAIDVDFVAWGPFATQSAMCAGLSSGTIIDCSYSTAGVENFDIPSAIAGQWYMVLVTNFSDLSGVIQIDQTNSSDPGAGSTNCNLITVSTTACTAGNYTLNGSIQLPSFPATGTLTVSTSCGGNIVFNAPFSNLINFSIPGLCGNGLNCTVNAVFSASGAPNILPTTYVAPTCNTLTAVAGSCSAGSYTLTGSLNSPCAPATGTVTISTSCGGSVTYSAPFPNPINYTIPGNNGSGGTCTVSVIYSASGAPTIPDVTYIAPTCCSANAGTVTLTITNGTQTVMPDGILEAIICPGGSVVMNSNNNFVLPPNGCGSCTAGLMYFIYSSLGPSTNDPDTDPNWTGYYWTGGSFPGTNTSGLNFNNSNECNELFTLPSAGPGYATISNNSAVFVPVTADAVNLPAHDNNNDGCFNMGQPIRVTFINPITFIPTVNCDGTVNVQINGGYPEFFLGQYSLTNTGSGTLDDNLINVGGTVTISGLTSGQTYSFSVNDGNGCSKSFSGLYSGSPIVNINPASSNICQSNSVALNATVNSSVAIGNETFTNGNCVNIFDGGIPDGPPAANNAGPATVLGNWSTSSINVSGFCGGNWATGQTLTVCMDIIHSWDADLNIFLQAPNGVFVKLSDDNGSSNNNYSTTCFSMSAATLITAGTAPFNGTYIPEGNFSGFNGTPINGIWKLWVGDDSAIDDGDIVNWSITFANQNNYTYSWSPTTGLSNATILNPIATPTVTTPYSLTVTNSCGCSTTATSTITVNPIPNAGTNGAISLCSNGSAINLFSSLGGTPQSTGTWSGPSVLTGGNLGTFTPGTNLPGVYTYTINGVPPCTNASATVTVTLNTFPDAGTNGSITLCSNGSSINLFSQLGGTPQSTGTWSGPSVLTGGNLGTFNPGTNLAGIYTYTILGTAPCVSSTATVTVTINPSASAGTNGSTTICSNSSSLNLFSLLGGSPQSTGTWSGPSVLGGGNLGTFIPGTNIAGVYTYTIIGASPCSNSSSTVTIAVNPSPNAGTNGNISLCSNGSTINLFTLLGGSPQSSGTWSGPSVLGGGNLGTFDPTTNLSGIYTYTVLGTAPCSNSTATVTVTINTAANSGTNGSKNVCSNGVPVNLFSSLGGLPQNSGTWSGPSILGGGNLGTFIPGTNTPGVYTYTVLGTPPCLNSTSTVTVSVAAAPNAGTNGTINLCSNGSSVNLFSSLGGTPQISGSWSGPSILGGGYLGTFTPGVNVAGIYTYTRNGFFPCSNSSATVSVSISTLPNATINYSPSAFCTNYVGSIFPSITGTVGGTFSASPSGLSINSTDGQITPSLSTPGLYVVTYLIPASGSCPSFSFSQNIVINSIPISPVLTPLNPCASSSTNFNASGGSIFEFFVNGVSQAPPSNTGSTILGPLVDGDVVCVNSYPPPPFNLEGNINEPLWGSALANSTGGPVITGFGPGNNIDAIYLQNFSNSLYGAIAGNVLNNSNIKVLLFIDCQPGGNNSLSTWVTRNNAPYWSIENLNNNITFDPGFSPEYILGMNQATGDTYFDLYNMLTNTNNYLGSSLGSPTLGFIGNAGVGDFTKGFEFAIPMNFLGNPTGTIKVFAMIVNDPGGVGIPTFICNQFLTRCGPAETNYGNGAINFGAAIPNPITYTLSADCFSTSCVNVVSSVIPTFNTIAPICSGDPVPSLPLVSTNGISGTWSPPSINNLSSAIYTFTPNPGQCASSINISITVVPIPTTTPINHD